MNSMVSVLGQIVGWVWTIIAGGGGLWLLFTNGPWPPTNGWFALLSGIVACPLVAWALKKYASIRVSGWLQFAIAIVFFAAGHIALTIWPHK
jgi:hypothetical protein